MPQLLTRRYDTDQGRLLISLSWLARSSRSATRTASLPSIPQPAYCPGTMAERSPSMVHKCLRRRSLCSCLRQGQLEVPRHYSRHGDVFVKRLPPQGVAVQSKRHLFELLSGSDTQQPKPVGRKVQDVSICKLKEDIASLHSGPDSRRFIGSAGSVNFDDSLQATLIRANAQCCRQQARQENKNTLGFK